MGTFTWKTADTDETIWVNGFGDGPKTVYLLQPNGLPPIREDAHLGIGRFGGTDAYYWLGKTNISEEKANRLSAGEIIEIGIALDVGHYFIDSEDQSKHAIFHKGPHLYDEDIKYHESSYNSLIDGYNQSANDLIKSGRWVEHSLEPKFPLKFSFNEKARYEDLGASPTCSTQGVFADEPD